jgi:ribosomal protein L6P/L9E
MEKIFYSKPILIHTCITLFKKGNYLFIQGPLGHTILSLPENIFFEKDTKICRLFGSAKHKNLILTYSTILTNKLVGVYLGFFEILVINGVGWRVSLEKNMLIFSLGYSHPIKYFVNSDIEVIFYDKQRFKIFGLELDAVQQVVADLCKLRIFNVYKGKGVYKEGHVFKLKESSKSKA